MADGAVPPDAAQVSALDLRAGAADHDPAGVGADRLPGVRRPADPHQDAAGPVRAAPQMDGPGGIRGRDRGLQPAARPGLHAARDLLRVAAAAPSRRPGRRHRVHRAGIDRHPGPGRAVPEQVPAAVGAGRGSRGRGCGPGGGHPRRGQPHRPELETPQPDPALADLPDRGCCRRRDAGRVAGPGHPGLRGVRTGDTAGRRPP